MVADQIDLRNVSCEQLHHLLGIIGSEGDCLIDAEDIKRSREADSQEWLRVLEAAMQAERSVIVDAHNYYWLVAELLVRERAPWATMNATFRNLFEVIGANLSTFNLIHSYGRGEGWELSPQTKRAVLEAFRSRGAAAKFILRLDGEVREVLRNCE